MGRGAGAGNQADTLHRCRLRARRATKWHARLVTAHRACPPPPIVMSRTRRRVPPRLKNTPRWPPTARAHGLDPGHEAPKAKQKHATTRGARSTAHLDRGSQRRPLPRRNGANGARTDGHWHWQGPACRHASTDTAHHPSPSALGRDGPVVSDREKTRSRAHDTAPHILYPIPVGPSARRGAG